MKKKILLSVILLIFILSIQTNVMAGRRSKIDGFERIYSNGTSGDFYDFKVDSTNNNEDKGPLMKKTSDKDKTYTYTDGGQITLKIYHRYDEDWSSDPYVIVGISPNKSSKSDKDIRYAFYDNKWQFWNKNNDINISATHSGEYITIKITFNKENTTYKYVWLGSQDDRRQYKCKCI